MNSVCLVHPEIALRINNFKLSCHPQILNYIRETSNNLLCIIILRIRTSILYKAKA
jgi:hypothetical protein